MAETDARLNPAALTPADAARVLTAAGGQRVAIAALEADVAAGAPTNADGTLNLVQYAAWLVREAAGGGGSATGRRSTCCATWRGWCSSGTDRSQSRRA